MSDETERGHETSLEQARKRLVALDQAARKRLKSTRKLVLAYAIAAAVLPFVPILAGPFPSWAFFALGTCPLLGLPGLIRLAVVMGVVLRRVDLLCPQALSLGLLSEGEAARALARAMRRTLFAMGLIGTVLLVEIVLLFRAGWRG